MAKKEQQKILSGEGMLALIDWVRQGVLYMQSPLAELYRGFVWKPFEQSGFLDHLSENGLLSAYLSHRDEFGFDRFLDSRITSFAQALGRLPALEQVKACEMLIETLEANLRKRKDSFPGRKKVYQALGISLGIGIVILLL